MAVLELHFGGRDPIELAGLEEEAARVLRELADALPTTDALWHPADLLADALGLRVSRRKFNARRKARTDGS